MAPEHWSKSTLAQIISILIMIIIFGAGWLGGQNTTSARVELNKDTLTKTTENIKYVSDMHIKDMKAIDDAFEDLCAIQKEQSLKINQIHETVIRLEEKVNNKKE